jgi:hypothetical protein
VERGVNFAVAPFGSPPDLPAKRSVYFMIRIKSRVSLLIQLIFGDAIRNPLIGHEI